MKREEALQIDQKYNLLPGGQGEHDFSPADTKEKIYDRLASFAEDCGGGASWHEDRISLGTNGEGTYRLLFNDAGKLIKVTRTHWEDARQEDGSWYLKLIREVLYWDSRRARTHGSYFQNSNVTEPLLEDLPEEVKQAAIAEAINLPSVTAAPIRAIDLTQKMAFDMGYVLSEIIKTIGGAPLAAGEVILDERFPDQGIPHYWLKIQILPNRISESIWRHTGDCADCIAYRVGTQSDPGVWE